MRLKSKTTLWKNMLYIFIQSISKYWRRKTNMNIITQMIIVVEEENEITSFPLWMYLSVFVCSLSISLSLSLRLFIRISYPVCLILSRSLFFNTVADIISSSVLFTLMTLYAMCSCALRLNYFIELMLRALVMGKFMQLNELLDFWHIVCNFDSLILNLKSLEIDTFENDNI